jgi:transcriptional regulator with XRE-family HTH domain
MTVEVRELRTTAQRVRQFRRAAGFTKSGLATRAGVSADTISRIENGDVTGYNTHIATLAAVASALGVKSGELVNRGHVIPL